MIDLAILAPFRLSYEIFFYFPEEQHWDFDGNALNLQIDFGILPISSPLAFRNQCSLICLYGFYYPVSIQMDSGIYCFCLTSDILLIAPKVLWMTKLQHVSKFPFLKEWVIFHGCMYHVFFIHLIIYICPSRFHFLLL